MQVSPSSGSAAPAGKHFAATRQGPSLGPLQRQIAAAERQTRRARRAEAVRLKQRAVLLDMLARAMVELHISMAELGTARRALLEASSGAAAD